MPHVGRFYKLWFRRDLAVHTNDYKFAYPEAYLTGFTGITSDLFKPQLKVNNVLAINTRKDSTIIRKWESELQGPGIELMCEIEFVNDPNDSQFVFHYRWRLDNSFRILDLLCKTIPLGGDYSGGFQIFQPDIIVKDNAIQINFETLAIKINAATWEDYPLP